jgi:ribosomal protein S18 acetylase RimI-like enzyme
MCSANNQALKVVVGPIARDSLPKVVEIHREAFPEGAITRLGAEAVRRYYDWQFVGPHDAHFLGAWLGEEFVGFCFCGQFREALRGFLARNRYFLAGCLLLRPWLLSHAEIRSAVVSAVRRLIARDTSKEVLTADSPADEQQDFGILSIAVAARCRRLGVGAKLMEEAETIARSKGFDAIGLTVHPDNTPAVRFYEKLGWTRVTRNGSWQGRMTRRF